MHDYICRQDVFDVLNKYASEKYDAEINKAIQDIPTADVQEVVHGKWLNFIGDFSTAECSNCGEIYEVIPDEKPSEEFFKAFNECYKFCSRCGAKMDGGDKMSTGNETLF